MGKKLKTPSEHRASEGKQQTGLPVHGVYGVFLLIVAASVMYANYRVFFGVEDTVARIMLIPSTLAVAIFLVYKAAK